MRYLNNLREKTVRFSLCLPAKGDGFIKVRSTWNPTSLARDYELLVSEGYDPVILREETSEEVIKFPEETLSGRAL